MLADGLFTSDPHPGNLMILPDGRLGLIDFGQAQQLLYECLAATYMKMGCGVVVGVPTTYRKVGCGVVVGLATTYRKVRGCDVTDLARSMWKVAEDHLVPAPRRVRHEMRAP